MAAGSADPLGVFHVFRAPLGGLFRHVLDLAAAQTDAGHAVGIVCGSGGSAAAKAALDSLAPRLRYGIARWPMPRQPGPGDFPALLRLAGRLRRFRPDILHGHGAKGGLYARLAPSLSLGVAPRRFYTPHGGSAHYDPTTLAGRIYHTAERALAARTDGYIFESHYAKQRFEALIGRNAAKRWVIHNGIRPEECTPVALRPDAADIVFLGELRHLKGVDVLLQAAALLRGLGNEPSVEIIGAGPDEAALRQQARQLGLARTRFFPPQPARDAFSRARVLALPSRAESLPYVLLEAGGARRTWVAAAVGGIPEIASRDDARLVAPDDPVALANALAEALAENKADEAARTGRIAERIASSFTVAAMARAIEAAYRAT